VNPPTDYTAEEIELAKGLLAIGVGAIQAAEGRRYSTSWEAASDNNRIGILAIARHVLAQSAKLPASQPSALNSQPSTP
jgi:hypothetical protein